MNVGMILRSCVLATGLLASVTSVTAETTLPAGYLRLSSVTSTDTQSINTGYKVLHDDVIVLKMNAPRNQGTSTPVAFGWGANQNKLCLKFFNAGSICYARNGKYTDTVQSALFDRDVVVTCTGTGISWTDADGTGGESYLINSPATADATDALCVFSRDSGNDKSSMTLYSLKVTSAKGDVKLDLVPCLNPNGVPGLYNVGSYDIPGGNFLSSATPLKVGDGEFLTSIGSSGACYLQTDYKVLHDDEIVLKMNAPKNQGTASTPVAFGWGANQNKLCLKFFNAGSICYARNGKYTDTVQSALFDRDVVVTCTGTGISWTNADGTGGESYLIKTPATADATDALCVFSREGGNDKSSMTLYSMKVTGSDQSVRLNLVPFRKWNGTVGLRDLVSGKFYGANGTSTAGSALFVLEGSNAFIQSGTLAQYDYSLFDAVIKTDTAVVEASALESCKSLVVAQGTYSLANAAAQRVVIAGKLSITGGVALTFDVTADGNDSFAPQTLDFSAVTAANPVVFNLMYSGLETLGDREITLIESGLEDGDEGKFTVNSCPDPYLEFKVVNGALVASRSQRVLPEAKELPAGYVRLGSVSSTGAQSINTGYKVLHDDVITVRMDVPKNQGTEHFVAAFGWSSIDMLNSKAWDEGKIRYARDDHYTGNESSSLFDRDVVVTCTSTGISWTNADGTGGESFTLESPATSDAANALCVFSRDDGWDPSFMTLYSFKVTSAKGDVKLDLVPCLDPNGVPGLYNVGSYDIPGGNFLSSTTSTPLKVGDGEILSSIGSSGACYVQTDYKVLHDDEIVLKMNAPKNQGAASATCAFGWGLTQQSKLGLKLFNEGSICYARNGNYTDTVQSALFDRDVVVTCTGTGISWTNADGTGGESYLIKSPATADATDSLCVFSRVGGLDKGFMTLYSMKVTGSDQSVRRVLVPFRKWSGGVGLRDLVSGKFYGANGTSDTGSVLCELAGRTAVVREGTLPEVDFYRLHALQKIGSGTVSAANVVRYSGLDVAGGVFSFANGKLEEIDVAGPLTLNGGATIGLDVTADGCDTIKAESVNLLGTGRIVLNVALEAGVTLFNRSLTLIPSGLSAGDEKKFKVRGNGVHGKVVVENGALVLQEGDGMMVILK